MNCCWDKHCWYQYYWLEDGEAPCSQGNLGLMCKYGQKRCSLSTNAAVWSRKWNDFNNLRIKSREIQTSLGILMGRIMLRGPVLIWPLSRCWRILFPVSMGLAFSSLYSSVSSPVWLSSHSSSCANMLCLQGSWWFSELLQVPWGLLLLEWQPWFSQIPAGGWTILRPTSGSCGSSEPIQAPQCHECYGWHSSLPHYRTSPLSCSWIHSSPWLAVPHRSPLLVGHLRTFINWAVFSGRWRSPWF